MSFFRLFKPRGTAPVARERLQILLSHERAAVGPRDLVAILRDELLATIKRHVEIDPEKLSVKMDRSAGYSTLEIDVEIPCEKIDVAAARRRRRRPGDRRVKWVGQKRRSTPEPRQQAAMPLGVAPTRKSVGPGGFASAGLTDAPPARNAACFQGLSR